MVRLVLSVMDNCSFTTFLFCSKRFLLLIRLYLPYSERILPFIAIFLFYYKRFFVDSRFLFNVNKIRLLTLYSFVLLNMPTFFYHLNQLNMSKEP